MSEIRFPLPDVGEGLTEAEIVQWRVAPGDRIALDQVFVEIETAKSLVELPSAFEGVVSELLVDEGKTVDVGTPILVIQTDVPAPADSAPSAPVAVGTPPPAARTRSSRPPRRQRRLRPLLPLPLPHRRPARLRLRHPLLASRPHRNRTCR